LWRWIVFFLMGFSNMIFFTKLMGFPPKNDGRWEFSWWMFIGFSTKALEWHLQIGAHAAETTKKRFSYRKGQVDGD
jgi:hypothetical protein